MLILQTLVMGPAMDRPSRTRSSGARKRFCRLNMGRSTPRCTVWKAEAFGNAAFPCILFEDGSYLRQVKTEAVQVSVVSCNLHGEIALRRANIGKGAVFTPGELAGYRLVSAPAEAGHRSQKFLQARRFSVQSFERRQGTVTSFVFGGVPCVAPRSGETRMNTNGGYTFRACRLHRSAFVCRDINRLPACCGRYRRRASESRWQPMHQRSREPIADATPVVLATLPAVMDAWIIP
jgi:hypothetical protein